jgi:hypothetical protein
MTHNTGTYDIFELAKGLKDANIPEEAINAFVKFEKAKDESMINNLATKNDVVTLKWIISIGFTILALMIALK